MVEPKRDERPEASPARLRAEARFLAAWGTIRDVQADEAAGLEAIEKDELLTQDLRAFAGALARALREPAAPGPLIRAHALALRAWLAPLLDASGARPDAAILLRAAKLLVKEARGKRARRGLLLAKLSLLVEARAQASESLVALAQDERARGEPELAASLEKIARENVSGGFAGLAQASQPFTALERLVLARAVEKDALAPALRRLARLENLGAEGSPGAALARVARAAADKARPVKRALEGVVSGIEGALGLDAPRAPARPPEPPPAPPGDPGELAAKITVREVHRARPAPSSPIEEPAAPAASVKTIGPGAPDEPREAPTILRHAPGALDRQGARELLTKARVAFGVLELEAEPDLDAVHEVGGDLSLLREMLADARDEEGQALRRELDDLELRFVQWKKRNEDS